MVNPEPIHLNMKQEMDGLSKEITTSVQPLSFDGK